MFMKKNLLLILIFFVFILTLPINADSKNKETYEYLDLFGQIFDRVRSSYVDEITDEELIEKAIDGMLTGLDPHSGYMNEEVYKWSDGSLLVEPSSPFPNETLNNSIIVMGTLFLQSWILQFDVDRMRIGMKEH